jgi:hypothetical protein
MAASVVVIFLVLTLQWVLACHTGSPNCNPGYYCESAVCVLCQPGRYKDVLTNTGPNTCTSCTPGYYSNTGASVCTICSAGSYSVTNNSASCTACSAGLYSSVVGSTTVTTCTACPAGFSSPSGSSSCSVCPPGTSLDLQAGQPCVPCPVGFYSTQNSSTTCSSCPVGTSTAVAGLSTCDNCSAGLYNDKVANVCNPCPINSFSFQGSSSCFQCAIGTSSMKLTGLSSCLQCYPGLFGDKVGVDCMPCPVNYFSNLSGLTSCFKCLAGKSTNDQKNASTCSDCTVGFYNAIPGSTCLPCGRESFANVSGLRTCYPCINSVTAALGSISAKQCILCNEGTFGTPPQTPCKVCPVGLGLSCPQGSNLPFIADGFFRDPNNPEVALRCSPASSCLASQDNRITPCSTGYQGFLCGECAAHFYRIDQECRACPSAVMGALTVLGALSLLLLAIFRTMKSNLKFSSDTRIVLQSLQIIALYPQITIKWPKPIISFFQLLSIAVMFPFFPNSHL